VRAWTKFYSYSSMWQRYTLKLAGEDHPGSSWVQALGFWPLNLMQHRLAHHKIAGGMQRFRAGVDVASAFAGVRPPSSGSAGLAPTPVGHTALVNPLASAFGERRSDGRKALHVLG
jgi:hypothetical protein